VEDNFTGSDGAPLATHAPDTDVPGATWTSSGDTPSLTPMLQNGVAAISGAGPGHLQSTLASGASDIRMSVDYHVGSGPGMGGLAFRLADTQNHFLLVTYGSKLQLYRRKAGLYVLLATQRLRKLKTGSTHHLEVRTNGSAIEGWWDGQLLVQTIDDFQQTATRHGLDWNPEYDATTTFDNFKLEAQ
jgi:hypothetical protein